MTTLSMRETALANLRQQSGLLHDWCVHAENQGDATDFDRLRDLRARTTNVLNAIARVEQFTTARHRSPLDPAQPLPRDELPPLPPRIGMDRNAAKRVELGIVR